MKKIVMFFVLLAFAGRILGMDSYVPTLRCDNYDRDVYLPDFASQCWQKLLFSNKIKNRSTAEKTAVLVTLSAFLDVVGQYSTQEADKAESLQHDRAILKASADQILDASSKIQNLLAKFFYMGDLYDSIELSGDTLNYLINNEDISQHIQDIIKHDRSEYSNKKYRNYMNEEYSWNRSRSIAEYEILNIILEEFEIVVVETYIEAIINLPENLTQNAFAEPGKIEKCFRSMNLSDGNLGKLPECHYCSSWIKKLRTNAPQYDSFREVVAGFNDKNSVLYIFNGLPNLKLFLTSLFTGQDRIIVQLPRYLDSPLQFQDLPEASPALLSAIVSAPKPVKKKRKKPCVIQ